MCTLILIAWPHRSISWANTKYGCLNALTISEGLRKFPVTVTSEVFFFFLTINISDKAVQDFFQFKSEFFFLPLSPPVGARLWPLDDRHSNRCFVNTATSSWCQSWMKQLSIHSEIFYIVVMGHSDHFEFWDFCSKKMYTPPYFINSQSPVLSQLKREKTL